MSCIFWCPVSSATRLHVVTNSTANPGDRDPRPSWQDLIVSAEQHLGTADDGRIPITHHNDLPWNFLPPPRRWHRCQAQSRGSCGPFRLVERCPCGGTRLDGRGRWLYRNRRALEHFGIGAATSTENVGNEAGVLLEMNRPLTQLPGE